jgi:tetratricopeptide (TPR) repeat protein
MFSINRCFIEADHGRVKLALERLRDLADQFPPNPHIWYAEGLIRRDYLGLGSEARATFQRAYEIALGKPDKQETRWVAACNVAGLAANEQEFRHWAEVAFKETPTEHRSDGYPFAERLAALDRGESYSALLFEEGRLASEAGGLGTSAAMRDVALLSGELTLGEELDAHKSRAQSLRAVDERENRYREPMGEEFPADERLALHEAIKALDAAIALDDHDAELWNFKSAWCYLLGEYQEAIQNADQAIALRPHHYPRPHINKASALWQLDRLDEAQACAREAVKQAQGYEVLAALKQAEALVEECSKPRVNPTIDDLQPRIKALLAGAHSISQEELGQHRRHIPIENIVRRLINHLPQVRSNPFLGYVPVVADLLCDFTPETAFCVSLKVAGSRGEVVEYCLTAALHIAAHSVNVQRRDATRYLALMTLFMMDSSAIRAYYRQAILEPSAAATDEMSQLDEIVREELGRINRQFPELIADQEPVDEAGRARATRNILSHLTGNPPPPTMPTKLGCLGNAALVVLLIASVVFMTQVKPF